MRSPVRGAHSVLREHGTLWVAGEETWQLEGRLHRRWQTTIMLGHLNTPTNQKSPITLWLHEWPDVALSFHCCVGHFVCIFNLGIHVTSSGIFHPILFRYSFDNSFSSSLLCKIHTNWLLDLLDWSSFFFFSLISITFIFLFYILGDIFIFQTFDWFILFWLLYFSWTVYSENTSKLHKKF